MNELIQIQPRAVGGTDIQTVNARDLHAFLGVGARFNDWIKRRIADFQFEEGADYVKYEMTLDPRAFSTPELVPTQKKVAPESMTYEDFGQARIDYEITVDMAKELAMVERNEKGKQARQYFIECERKAKVAALDPLAFLSDPSAMRGLLLNYTEKVIALQSTVDAQAAQMEEQTPKIAALNRIATHADGALCVTDAAKTLQIRPKDLFAWLVQNKWIYRRPQGKGWLAYQDALQRGVMEHKIRTGPRPDGGEWVDTQPLVTPKGLVKIAEALQPA